MGRQIVVPGKLATELPELSLEPLDHLPLLEHDLAQVGHLAFEVRVPDLEVDEPLLHGAKRAIARRSVRLRKGSFRAQMRIPLRDSAQTGAAPPWIVER